MWMIRLPKVIGFVMMTTLAACSGSSGTTAPTTNANVVPTPSVCGTRTPVPTSYDHVVWIWMENKHYHEVIGSGAAPFITALARQCGTATHYATVGNPSLPNYLGATSGDTRGISDDGSPARHRLIVDNLFRQVRTAGHSERSYVENMPSNCALDSQGSYAVKHNPAAYYTGGSDRTACAANDIPLGTSTSGPLVDDLRHDTMPAFAFIVPDLCDDTHDCAVAAGDHWLTLWLSTIVASNAYQSGRMAVFVIWDEYTPLPNVVISPTTKPGSISPVAFNHYSLLRTAEEMLGLHPLLGGAANANSMRAAFNL